MAHALGGKTLCMTYSGESAKLKQESCVMGFWLLVDETMWHCIGECFFFFLQLMTCNFRGIGGKARVGGGAGGGPLAAI